MIKYVRNRSLFCSLGPYLKRLCFLVQGQTKEYISFALCNLAVDLQYNGATVWAEIDGTKVLLTLAFFATLFFFQLVLALLWYYDHLLN